MKTTIAFIIAALTTAALACPGSSPNSGCAPDNTAMASPDHDHSSSEHKAHTKGTVEVTDNGTKFDPAVAKSKIPDGAWACVMGGKVHYASMEKGKGECPLCGMDLQKAESHRK